MRNNFTKKERLCSLKEIENLVKKGKSFYCFPFKVISISKPATVQTQTEQMGNKLSAEENVNSIVVSVPKRNFKRAVKRNLLKRRIRESYRLNKHILSSEQRLNILFVYIAKEILDFEHIESKMKDILKTLSNELKD